MRWLKKFALVLLNILIGTLLLVILLFRLPFFNFRESSEKQTEAITEFGQQTPRFHDYETELPDGKKRNIHYVHVGDESKPLLLLVHGSPGSSSAMNVYLADTNLTKVVQVVAVDRPGFGFSDFGKTEISLAYQSLALKPIVEKYGSNGAILLGHSLGGPVIARMAMDYPELITGLVVVAGSISPELEPQEWWRKPLDSWTLRWILPKSFRVSNEEIMYVKKELDEMMPLWEKITCPVIVYQGDEDKLVPMENALFAEKMLVNSKSVEINMLAGQDHFILWSMKDDIVAGVQNLIELP